MQDQDARSMCPKHSTRGVSGAIARAARSHARAWVAGALLALAGNAPIRAHAEADCFGAADALARQDWQEARMLLQSRLANPGCRAHDANLRYSLAYVLERLGESCAAGEMYTRVVGATVDPTIGEAAGRAVERMAQRCAHRTAVAPRVEAESSMPWVTVGILSAAAITLAGGGVMLAAAADAQDERSAAEAEMRTSHGEGDVSGFAAARERFDSAADDTKGLGIAGYSALGLGITLALVGAGLLVTNSVSVAAGANHVAVSVRF